MSYLEELLPEFKKGAKIRRKDWREESILNYLEFTQKMNMAMFILLSLTK